MTKFELAFHRLSCDWEIAYFAETKKENLESEILHFIDDFSRQFSRFDPDSLLSRLNKQRELIVNDFFLELLDLCRYFYTKTNGLFHPLASPAHLGYTQNFEEKTFTKDTSDTSNLNLEDISIQDHLITLAPGQQLDFGGIGKGFLVDRLAHILKKISPHFFINAGGDIFAFGGKPDKTPWYIAIEHPQKKNDELVLNIYTGGVATSGTYKRKWKDRHHIIDPRTKKSAQTHIISATVMAENCMTADVLATCVIIAGKEKAFELLSQWSCEGCLFLHDQYIFTPGFEKFFL